MSPEPFYGEGYSLLPIRECTLNGQLAKWRYEDLSVLVVLAAHANRRGLAFPSLSRIATLGGLSKSSVGPSLERLRTSGWVYAVSRGTGRAFRLELGESADSVVIRHGVVMNGIWAAITPSARILFVLLQALSRPGTGRFGSALTPEEWGSAVKDGNEVDGYRHVLLGSAAPSELCRLCGIAGRTFRQSLNILIGSKLVETAEDTDAWLLSNNPNSWYPEVLAALLPPNTVGMHVAAGAKRALTARRRRRTQLAQQVPPRGISPSE